MTPDARIDDLLTSFAIDLEASGKADRTIKLYSQSVEMFAAWLAEQDRPETVDQITHSALNAWLAGLRQAGRQPGTIRLRVKGVQRFARWCVEEGELDSDPTDRLNPVRGPSKPVPVLSDAELSTLVKACQYLDATTRKPSPSWRRDEAMVRMLADTGVRVSELTGMHVDDVDLRNRLVVVTGKGSRMRTVPFASKTARAVDRWIRERRRHRDAEEPQLWLGKRGPMTPDGVRAVLDQLGNRVGVKIHPHMFRHTAASAWLANGGQERDLMRQMGWSSTAMLAVYGASAAEQRSRDAARQMRLGDRF